LQLERVAALRLQFAWRVFKIRSRQKQLQLERLAVKRLAQQCVGKWVSNAIMRGSAAVRLQKCWQKRMLRHSTAATQLQRAVRGFLVRSQLEADGVLAAVTTRADSRTNGPIQCEVRRCLVRRTGLALKVTGWELAAIAGDSSCQKAYRIICDEEAITDSQQETATLAEVASSLLQRIDIQWCEGELSLKLRTQVSGSIDSIPAEHEPSSELHSSARGSSGEIMTLDTQYNGCTTVASISVPWICTSCGFNNEVSPDACVLCDAQRGPDDGVSK